jgi:ABC-type transport system substrate-binding protein
MMLSRLLQPKRLAVVPLVVLSFVLLVTSGQPAQAQAKKWPDAFPKKGVGGVPESVNKLTIAVDSWGTSDLNPWALTSVSFLGDYFNLRLMMQDPNGDLKPAWATEYTQTDEGVTFKLNPKARFADGTPADAEAVKLNLEGFMGKFVKEAGYDAPLWNSAKANEFIESVKVISPTEVFVKTKGPKPTFMWNLGGNGYHLYWYGNPSRLMKGPKEYLKDPAGGGPYKIKEWDPGNRIVFERNEDFWADYPHWHKPQAKLMEILVVQDPAARFALLKSGQADIVYNLPWALAKGLLRSEDGVRGVNPGKQDVWTQTYSANGLLALTFGCPLQVREAAKAAGRKDQAGVDIPQWTVSEVCKNHPTLDQRVRRALNMAIDKKALSKGPHFGFSTAIGSIFHAGSFGARPDKVSNPSPYNLAEAKRLLAEAGYPNGFTMVGHFGQFAGRPGIPEAADFIASSWEKLGVKITWQEHDPSDFVRGFRAGVFSWVPVNLQTWGRQDHSGVQISWYHATSGYVGIYNDKVEELYFDISATSDPEEMKRKLAILEDEVLGLEETFPLYGMSLVNAYSDRVLAHPTVEFSPHFKHYDLVLLRK